MIGVVPLLIVLLFCHFFADYCFTTASMIRAKADGRNPWPIMIHAAVHTGLMAICLMLWGVSSKLLLIALAVECTTHFFVDWTKARLLVRFPSFADPKHKPYWMLYGFDQLLHQLVIVGIWYCCTK